MISYCSATSTDSCFGQFVFHLFSRIFSLLLRWFLTVLSQALIPVSTNLFSCIFSVFKPLGDSENIKASGYKWRFDVFLVSLWFSPFFNYPIAFIWASNFSRRLLGTTNVFCHTPLWIAFLNVFCYPFYCFTWQLFRWRPVSFQFGMANRLLKPASTELLCIFKLQLVFVLGIQITTSFHILFLNIGLYDNIFLYTARKKLY